jgi:hypothetical protein
MSSLIYFFSGAFFINGLPHFIQGICGNTFQTPFATPPGVGESSSVANVIWGAFNFLVSYAFFVYAGPFSLGFNLDAISFILGCFLLAVILSMHFGKIRKNK